jgi:hypothetical protein
VAYAVYTKKRCPTRTLDSIMSMEMWSRRRPCIAHMHIFAFALVLNEKTQIVCFLIIMRELMPID